MLSVCPSVRPSVTLRYVFHTGWNTSKISSQPNSLRPWLWDTQHGPPGATGTPPKLGLNRGEVPLQGRKPAISPKRCEIRPKLLLRTNRNSYTRFRLVPKSVTLGDLEGRMQGLSTSRKRVYEFLLVGNSNLGRISHRFVDIAGFCPAE